MKINLYIPFLFLSSLVVFKTGTFVHSDETQNVNSEATIKTLAGGNEAVPPVNPLHPDVPDAFGPDNPDDGNITNQTGPLQISYLSDLDFGEDIPITSKKVSANVKNGTPRFFQVSDLRGTGGGWELNVALGDFSPVQSSSTSEPIEGAEIVFKSGQAVTSNATNAGAAVVNDVTLSAGSSHMKTLLSATKGNGLGTWLARFTEDPQSDENADIVFNAPANNISANTEYQATLTWQLVDSVK